ncbi:MAG: DUF350 domain-containing protein [Planctomycetaceae bacterium]
MLNSLVLAAAETAGDTNSGFDLLGPQLLSTIIFAAIGVMVFLLVFWLIVKLTPFSVRKEIEEDQNTSLAVIVGSVLIGLAIIIAAAIRG